MNALRQQALEIVNNVPENLLAALVENLIKFKQNAEIDPKKAAAFSAIEEWQNRNKNILNSGIDWDKELEEAICTNEKYKKYFAAD